MLRILTVTDEEAFKNFEICLTRFKQLVIYLVGGASHCIRMTITLSLIVLPSGRTGKPATLAPLPAHRPYSNVKKEVTLRPIWGHSGPLGELRIFFFWKYLDWQGMEGLLDLDYVVS